MPKRDSKGRFVKGTSGNPGGRPKDDKAWGTIVRDVGNMTAEEILEFIPKNNDLGRMIARLPKTVQMKYLVTARVFSALMFEPSSGLLNALMDRVDGKVIQPVDMTNKGDKFESGADAERFDRSILALADAIREGISGKGTEQNGEMDATE